MADEIVNKVANSGLVNIDLEEWYPKGERIQLDIAPWLYEGVMLREKEFRNHIQEHDWSKYRGAYVAVYCSEDAIIPQWAWLLLSDVLTPFAEVVAFGSLEMLESVIYERLFASIDFEQFRDKRVIVKGCSDKPVPLQAFVALTQKLKPLVKSLMYGEACSTVPISKNK